MKQVLLHTNTPAEIGAHQHSHNVMHCVSLDRQYSIARAHGSSKFIHMQNIALKSGVTQAAPAALFPVAV